MATVVIVPNPSTSHFNSTFKLARLLKRKGHKVVYIGEKAFQSHVEKQDFEYYELPVKPFREKALAKEVSDRASSFLGFLWFNFKSNYNGIRQKEVEQKIEKFDAFMAELNPDLLILDIFLSANLSFMPKYGVEIMIAQFFFPTDEIEHYPIINSKLIPNFTVKSKRKIKREWKRTYQKQYWLKKAKWLLYFSQDYWSIQQKIAQQNNVALTSLLDEKRIHHPGLKSAKELIFATSLLDFPRTKKPGQIYMGSRVDFNRVDIGSDPDFERRFAAIINQKRPIVYCAMGTLSMVHNSQTGVFLKKVIAAFTTMPEYNLVLSTGASIPPSYFGSVPDNVQVFYHVPQLKVLSHANVMIGHGGANSMEEAALSGVPILCYPTSNRWDQNGNAARICFHGIGLRGELKKATSKEIITKIETLVSSPVYRSRAQEIKKKVLESTETFEALNTIVSELPQQQAKEIAVNNSLV